MISKEKSEVLGGKPVPVLLGPRKTPKAVDWY
jgi:hypothetical protein